MKRNIVVFVSALLVVAFLAHGGFGQESEKTYPVDISKEGGLPLGAKMELLSENASPIPGFEKVRVLKLTMQPKSKIENFTTTSHHFCYAIAGKLEVTMQDGSKKVVKAGEEMIEPKGRVYSLLENKGTTPYMEVIFELVEAKVTAKQ